MPDFDPSNLSNWTGGEWTSLPEFCCNGFSIDSRKPCKNSLFVALKAERDGHDFLTQAISSGAIGGIVDHQVTSADCPQLIVKNPLLAFQEIARNHRKSFTGKVIGVTGSCGKTTTKEILNTLLSKSYCTEGNLNNHIGVPLTLSKISSEKHDYAVIEAGINQTDEMDKLAEMIDPDICLITSIAPSHLDGLGTIDTVAREKSKLWLNGKESTVAVFPEELLQFDSFAQAIDERPCITIREGACRNSDIPLNQVFYKLSTETNERGYSKILQINRFGCPPLFISIPHVSAGNIRNMVLACVAAWKLGVTDQQIFDRLPQYRPTGLRGSCLVGQGSSYVLDCYNANPASMLDSIEFLYEKFMNQSKLLILGGMNELGTDSKKLHYETGRSINLGSSDQVILIGEHTLELANGLMENGATAKQISIISNLENAKPIINEFTGVVLLKGSRSYQLERLIPTWAEAEIEPLRIAC